MLLNHEPTEFLERFQELDEADEDYASDLEDLETDLHNELVEVALCVVPLLRIMREVHASTAALLGEPVHGDWSDLDQIYDDWAERSEVDVRALGRRKAQRRPTSGRTE